MADNRTIPFKRHTANFWSSQYYWKCPDNSKLTNCLRVIRNAWHFYYALGFVVKVLCGGIGIALLTP
ncbi:DUF3265 domain-containing protein [Photobacterium sanctipauli]|uniref:DUF3265 domain-containing protein n=1 Tax=Photobacterium sanctipauli TaxID=1342794 RepID=A0A2T3N783_9GAMM|nr:DUF3265 domain-containing protein [Photobacterium sanctipauli]